MVNELPPDGTVVEAMADESIEYDLPARKVRGRLTTHWVGAFGGYMQCTVNGIQVDEETVKAVEQ